MSETYELKTIGHVRSDFPEKFGIPRQAGIVDALEAAIIFEPEYRREEALRGLEGFSHIWVIWQFSEAVRDSWSPTVRPPRLGGNARMGVFATRSPFRPNALGLSCVRLIGIEHSEEHGAYLRIAGADMLDGTPVYDIKPYVPYADCHTEALSGFASNAGRQLRVEYSGDTLSAVPEAKRAALTGVLANDPRPRYQNDPERVYAMDFAGLEIKFTVSEDTLTVRDISLGQGRR